MPPQLCTRSPRSRVHCGLVVLLLVPLGLATRSFPWLPEFIRDHAGDALWAALVYWGFALLLPRGSVFTITLIAAAFALTIELSQLSRHPLLIEARSTRLGALILGHGFLWIDLLRYAVGIALAALADLALDSRRKAKSEESL